MPKVARVGDQIAHGDTIVGEITSGSGFYQVDNQKLARVGDQASCNIHGIVQITNGSPTWMEEQQKVARVGDPLSCGAQIYSGSPTLSVDGS